jgi:hypothetical protein
MNYDVQKYHKCAISANKKLKIPQMCYFMKPSGVLLL